MSSADNAPDTGTNAEPVVSTAEPANNPPATDSTTAESDAPLPAVVEPASASVSQQPPEQSAAPKPAGESEGAPAPVGGYVKVFVGQLPKSISEEELGRIFEPYGPLLEVVLLRNKVTGVGQGCGFVKLPRRSNAENAIRCLNNTTQFQGMVTPMQVRFADGELERLGQTENKLFIGGCHRQTTAEDIRAIFAPFGAINEIFILKDDMQQCKGCAFVKYASRDDALNAIARCNGVAKLKPEEPPLVVRFADVKKKTNAAPNMMGGFPGGGMPLNPQMAAMNALIGAMAARPQLMGNMLGGMRPGAPAMPPPPGALPPGWVEYHDPEGRAYYHNAATNTTTWEPPAPERPPPGQWGGFGGAFGGSFNAAAFNAGGNRGGGGQQITGPMGANLFILRLPDHLGDQDLWSMFATFGTILSAHICTDRDTGRSKGYGFVSYSTVQEADLAIQAMNGTVIGGNRLKVERKRADGGGGSGGSSHGSNPY